MFPRVTAEAHIKPFLRANSNSLYISKRKLAKDKIEDPSATQSWKEPLEGLQHTQVMKNIFFASWEEEVVRCIQGSQPS